MDVEHETERQRVESDIKTDTMAEIPQGVVSDVQTDTSMLAEIPQRVESDTQAEIATVNDSLTANGCNGSTCATISDFVKPLCEEGRGCNYSLNCFNFTTLGNESFIPYPPSAVKISPLELDSILDNKTYANCCVVVMFFAPWCEFSAQFSRKFNAVGRAFNGLPVLAVNLDEPEP